jgi:hypothetical protein
MNEAIMRPSEETEARLSEQALAPRVHRKPLPSPTALLAPTDASLITPERGDSTVYTTISQDDDNHATTVSRIRPSLWKRLGKRAVWAPEILSISLAIIALVAIIVLLATRKNKPLPSWPSLLGINSLLAVFSSILKAAMILPVTECISELKWVWFTTPKPVNDFICFDQASRGPWGALRLLMKRPKNIRTSFGAAIILLALAIDTFTQQSLQFYSCPVPIANYIASIPKTNNYTIGRSFVSDEGAWLDAKMTGALYQGILNPSPNATVAISTLSYCPSGNCTFAHVNGVAYSTLAICSSVDNITEQVSGNSTIDGIGQSSTWYYSLPSGLNISSSGDEYAALATAGISNDTFDGSSAGISTIFVFEVLLVTSTCPGAPSDDKPVGCAINPLAVRIALSPCVQQFGSVSISGSILREQVLNTTLLMNAGGFYGYGVAGKVASVPGTDCTGSESPTSHKTLFTGRQLDSSANGNVSNATTEVCVDPLCQLWEDDPDPSLAKFTDILYYDPKCVFALAYGPASGMYAALEGLFGSLSNPSRLGVDHGLWQGDPNSTPWIEPLWSNGWPSISNISRVIDGLTVSMNAALRDEGDASNSAPLSGTVMGVQTCVAVSWLWLILPIALLAFTTTFLVATMVHSYRITTAGGAQMGRKPWKSSPLPLLWCGLQDWTRAQVGSLNDVGKMKDHGDDTLVSLERNGPSEGVENELEVHESRWTLKDNTVK